MTISEIFAIVLLGAIYMACPITAARCSRPDVPVSQVTLLSETRLRSEYAAGDVVVWGCDRGHGVGNVYLTCKSNGQWSDKNRSCGDQVPFDLGSLAGILGGAVCLLACVVSIAVSTKLHRTTEAENPTERKKVESRSASPNQAREASTT